MYWGLVPDDTVHMVASKRHITGKQTPILRCTFIHQHLNFLSISSWHQIPYQQCCGMFNFSHFDYCMRNMSRSFSSFFGLVPTPKNIYLFIDIKLFRFILLYTLVRRVLKYYIISNIMYKHNFPLTSFLTL